MPFFKLICALRLTYLLLFNQSVMSNSLQPMDCSPPRLLVHGILQARILVWVAIFFSRVSSWTRDPTLISCIGRRVLYHCTTREAQFLDILVMFFHI